MRAFLGKGARLPPSALLKLEHAADLHVLTSRLSLHLPPPLSSVHYTSYITNLNQVLATQHGNFSDATTLTDLVQQARSPLHAACLGAVPGGGRALM